MNYRYVGVDCEFASTGDVFVPSNGGKGYVHQYEENLYIGVPKDMVEYSNDFEPIEETEEDVVCDTCYLIEKIKEDFIDELREVRSEFCGRRSLSKIDDLIDFVENYQPTEE